MDTNDPQTEMRVSDQRVSDLAMGLNSASRPRGPSGKTRLRITVSVRLWADDSWGDLAKEVAILTVADDADADLVRRVMDAARWAAE